MKLTELEALEKSIILWSELIKRLYKFKNLEDLDESALSQIKEDIDPQIKDCMWHCYLCEYFITSKEAPYFVDCEACCVAKTCGVCNGFPYNEFEILAESGHSRIDKLRAANRILRAMRTRKKELEK
jgi:hypothetical protein